MQGSLKVLFAGSSGFLGKAVHRFLRERGYEVTPLVRSKSKEGIFWDPEKKIIDKLDLLESFDIVINFSGTPVFGRWNEKKKQEIERSRVETTSFLTEILLSLKNPPHTYVGASAAGFYGNTGGNVATESTPPGSTFLSQVCQEWEDAAQTLSSKQIRILHLRLGVVLGKEGGLLKKMALPLRMGSGKQVLSWIAMPDVLSALLFLIENKHLNGPFNFTSPYPVSNEELASEISAKSKLIPVPAFLLKVLLGKQAAEELLLNSSNVYPAKLIESGYQFQYPHLRNYLINILSI